MAKFSGGISKMIIIGEDYNFEIENDIFTIQPKGNMVGFDSLCFVEDLDNLFIAVNKAIEMRGNTK